MGVIYQDYISCQAYSQCTIFGCLGVLPEVLYHFCGSAPTRVVQETCLLIREYSQCLLEPFLWEHSHKHGIAALGVLPKTQNNYYWEYSRTCLMSGRSHIEAMKHIITGPVCTAGRDINVVPFLMFEVCIAGHCDHISHVPLLVI